MKINGETKISFLLKEKPESMEAIISVNPKFKKLRNPLLRGILASRTTLSDAARIGGSDINLLFHELEKIGFEPEYKFDKKSVVTVDDKNSEITEAINMLKVVTLDVRPVLDRGGDPFNEIMRELLLLEDGFVLKVINSFEPTPLIKVANNKGFDSMVETADDTVFTYFIKSSRGVKDTEIKESFFKVSPDEHNERKNKCGKNILEIDVRNLEMPLPMITILQELEELKEDEALYVHHKKIPQYLLPELEERNFTTWIAEIDNDNVKLLIHR